MSKELKFELKHIKSDETEKGTVMTFVYKEKGNSNITLSVKGMGVAQQNGFPLGIKDTFSVSLEKINKQGTLKEE